MLLIAVVVGAEARDTYAHDDSVLPKAARTTIANNFKSRVCVVKIEKTLGHIDGYEVTLSDGSEISFDNKGNWENVETASNKAVPGGFILRPMADYVKANHKGTKIVGIERERDGYEIELSNGIDLKFDKNGRFVRYDD